MGIRIIAALFFFCSFARAEDPLPEFDIKPAVTAETGAGQPDGPGGEDLADIRNRLVKSVALRSGLADDIMEAGIQDRVIPAEGLKTASEIRYALLEWISRNPGEAAEIYLSLRKGGGARLKKTVVTEQWWEFNPVFLRLIADVNRVADDKSVPREEASLIAARLFQGREADIDAVLSGDAVGGKGGRRGGGGAAQGAGDAAALEYADYKLDPAAAGREAKSMSDLLEGLKAALVEEGDAQGLKLSESAFGLYKDFLVALSGLKGRKMTGAESRKLEELRRELRRRLAVLGAVSARNRLRERSALLPAGMPGADILQKEAAELLAGLDAFSADGGDGGRRKLFELQKAADFWTFKFMAYMRLAELKVRLGKPGFGCVWDRAAFELLSRIAPSAGYPRLKKDLLTASFTINWGLEGVAAGDAALTGKFAGGSNDALFAKIGEIERKLAAVEASTKLNRRVQFLFWDLLPNPAGLAPAPMGVCARNKLLP